MAVQADERIVAAGYAYNGSINELALARYTSAGALDTSFGSGGKVTTDVGGGIFGEELAIQDDGKILVAGYAAFGTFYNQFVVVRYTSTGALDTSFGTDGIFSTSVRGSSSDSVQSMVLQSDGKILVAGISIQSNNRDFALIRLTSNGSLDTSFGSGGKVTTTFTSSSQDEGRSVAVQGNGKILVSGRSRYDFALIRYTAGGQLDTGFGSGGKVVTSFTAGTDDSYGVAVQSDGRIVSAGYAYPHFALARYEGDPPPPPPEISAQPVSQTVDALSDVTFFVAASGEMPLSYQWRKGGTELPGADSASLLLESVTTDEAGDYDVVVTGPNGTATSESVTLTVHRLAQSISFSPLQDRYASLPSFALLGHATSGRTLIYTSSDPSIATISGTTLTPVAPGATTIAASHPGDSVYLPASEIVQTLTLIDVPGPSGELDGDFGIGGKATLSFGESSDTGQAVTVQEDGKVVVAGYTSSESFRDFAVARFLVNGNPDPDFGSGGKVTTYFSFQDVAVDVAIQSDGKIIALGHGYGTGTAQDFALARYTFSGALDSTFGSEGKVMTAISGGSDFAQSLAIQADGKIIAAGYAHNGTDFEFAIARYTATGTLDTSFGTGGIAVFPIGGLADYLTDLIVRQDGKILVGGSTNTPDNGVDFSVAKLTSSGVLDTSFGTGGIVTIAAGVREFSWGIALQEDEKILLAGSSLGGSYYADTKIIRLTPDGALDASFGDGGEVITAVAAGTDLARDIAVQDDGGILVTGYANSGASDDFFLLRYTDSGILDPSFGEEGIVITSISGNDQAWDLAIAPSGKIVVAGASSIGSNANFAVVCYSQGGARDFDSWATSFGIVGEPDDDDDGNGIVNLIEYALGIDAGPALALTFPIEDGAVSFMKGLDAGLAGNLTYTIETSSDLVNWAPVIPAVDDGNAISYKVPAGNPCFFARLRITQN